MGGTLELSEDGTLPPSRGMGRGVDPLLGQRLLHYRVIEPIGQGGMSVVYRGHDELLRRDVAIKVLHPFLAQKPECRQRLAREARAVAKLEHENILKIFAYSGDPPTIDETPDGDRAEAQGLEHDADSQEGFLVVEFVPGGTLKQWANKNRVWTCPEIGALVICTLARSLAHAHEQGVVHRDIKPENVMVRDDGVLKLMDFGIAQVADAKSLTITGTLLGSPAHMAPECIEGYPADERSDLFSLGTVLYWLTTGELPFEALTPHALLKAIVDGKRSPAQQHQPRISDELSRIIDRSLATRPADRYATAADMADALDAYVASVGLDRIEIAPTLEDPPAAIPAISATVRGCFLAKAETLLDEGHAAKALGALSRVLAEFPGDEAATALLEQAHLGFDDDEDVSDTTSALDSASPDRMLGPEIDTAESRPSHLARNREESGGLISAPTGVPRPDRGGNEPITARTLARRIGLLAAVVGVLTLAVLVANAVEPTTRRDISEPAIAPPAENQSKFVLKETPIVVPPGLKIRTPKRDILPPKREKKVVVPIAPTPEAAVSALETVAGAAAAPVELRTLKFRVSPWADIYVDGEQIAVGKSAATIEIAPGKHVVRLANKHAVEETREITVPVEGHVSDVVVMMKVKQARLVIVSNVDADVLLKDIEGGARRFAGTSKRTATRPIPISFNRSSERTYDVVLHKSGYKSLIRRVTFAAGKTETLEVVLQPDPDGAEPAGRQPIQPER